MSQCTAFLNIVEGNDDVLASTKCGNMLEDYICLYLGGKAYTFLMFPVGCLLTQQ